MLTNVFRSSLLGPALDEAHRLLSSHASSKNVYELYARHSFASLVIPLFLEAYKWAEEYADPDGQDAIGVGYG